MGPRRPPRQARRLRAREHARGAIARAPGRRQRAPQHPPPPKPRVARSSAGCLDQSGSTELVVDLAPEAIAERHIDESQNRDKKRQRQTDYGEWHKEQRRDGEDDSAHSLGEVVRLGPVLDRSGLDDSSRLEDLEVELFEQRQTRRKSAQQQHDAQQRDQDERRPEEGATDESDE